MLSAIKKISFYLKEQNNIKIKLDDVKGDFLKRSNKYFHDGLNFSLYQDNIVLEKLKMLSVIRNSIAHGNGRIESSKNKEKLTGYIEKNIGISDFNGNLICSDEFLRKNYFIIDNFLKNLLQRVRAKARN